MSIVFNSDVTQDKLRLLFRYNKKTGVFVWIRPPKEHPRMLGLPAGSVRDGYLVIKIGGKAYRAHRLAWLYVYGNWPLGRIDHKDTNPLNNAIRNLRDATAAQNCANVKNRAGKALPKGVRKSRSRFQARIKFEKKSISLGVFDDPESASRAYFRKAVEIYGEFARK